MAIDDGVCGTRLRTEITYQKNMIFDKYIYLLGYGMVWVCISINSVLEEHSKIITLTKKFFFFKYLHVKMFANNTHRKNFRIYIGYEI